LRRVSFSVPIEQAEQARARMVELFPEGFEEVARRDRVELAVYTDASGATRIWRTFGEFSWREVPEDWADRWQRFHRAVRIGPLWVGPPWEPVPAGALGVVIDPGRAFGTGAHETTRLCLELLLLVKRGSLLDVGCGSGVLAIAAARLGFGPIVCVDHDPVAVETARANAAANGVELDVRLADGFVDPLPPCDAAVANISATGVEEVAARLSAPRLVTAGYLEGDRVDFPGYRVLERRSEKGWEAHLLARV